MCLPPEVVRSHMSYIGMLGEGGGLSGVFDINRVSIVAVLITIGCACYTLAQKPFITYV